jgi:DegV family protein with EDD domain
MIVLEAAEAAEATNDLATSEQAARAVISRVRVHGALDTMENLRRGGRVGSAKALLGSLLSIKPIIEIRDGVVEAESRQRTRTRSLEYLAGKVTQAGPLEGLAVAHAAAPDLDVFLEMLVGTFPPEEIVVNYIGPVIGTHAGPGCIGVCYRLAPTVDR